MKIITMFLHEQRLANTLTQRPTQTISMSLNERDKEVAQAQLASCEKEHEKEIEKWRRIVEEILTKFSSYAHLQCDATGITPFDVPTIWWQELKHKYLKERIR